MKNYMTIEFKDRHDIFKKEEQYLTINLDDMTIKGNETSKENLLGGVYSKVVDTGVYTLNTIDNVYVIEEDYVPDCIPNDGEDYLDIECKDSKLTNWKSSLEEIIVEFQEKGVLGSCL